MKLIRISFVLIIWVLILSSCSVHATIDPIPNKITDTNGKLHYYTMYRLTNFNEPVRYCRLHEQWEKVQPINGVIQWNVIPVAIVVVGVKDE